MTVRYTGVGWNRHKVVYDLCALAGVVLFIATFVIIGVVTSPSVEQLDPMVLLIRAFGTCAIVLLHIILLIGPLSRFTTRLNPLLYNRRHLGVLTFIVSLLHGGLVLLYYHGFGEMNPVVSLLYNSATSGVPFELFGVVALLILFLMAATSHDFWLKNLTPPTWKVLHMLVYVAYLALIFHVAFGAMQSDRNLLLTIAVGVGAATIITAHLAAGRREARRPPPAESGEWLDVGSVDDVEDRRAITVCVRHGERIAVFRNGTSFSAVSDVCEHQNGPLSEGEIIDGCITCPWHGYQYRPEDGQSPPPYTERIATYDVRIDGRRILVNPQPHPKGTPVEPARLANEADA